MVASFLTLAATRSLWRQNNMELSFSFAAEDGKNVKFRVFWTESPGDSFRADRSVEYSSNQSAGTVRMSMPTEKMWNFRLHADGIGRRIAVSDVRLSAAVTSRFGPDMFVCGRGMTPLPVRKGWLVLETGTEDSFITPGKEIDISGGIIRWEILVIIFLFSFFFFAAVVGFLSGFRARGGSWSDICFVSIFFLLLAVPAMHITEAEKSDLENISFPPKPKLFTDGILNSKYGEGFDAWFKYRFFGRFPLIYAYNFLRFSICPETAMYGNALSGSDGWLYTRYFNSIEMYRNANLFTQDELNICAENIRNFVEAAHRKGVRQVYFVLHNDKESMYPEYYPSCILKAGKTSRLEQLLDFVHASCPEVHFLNFKAGFDKIKRSEVVYNKAGTHMNPLGDFYSYSFLMEEMKKDFPGMYSLKLEDFTVREEHPSEKEIDVHQGDIFLRCFVVNPWYSADHFRYKSLSGRPPEGIEKKSVEKEYKVQTSIRSPKSRGTLKIFIMSDSFMARDVWLFPYTFRMVYSCFVSAGKDFLFDEDDCSQLKRAVPDVILIATTERFLHRFLTLKFPEI